MRHYRIIDRTAGFERDRKTSIGTESDRQETAGRPTPEAMRAMYAGKRVFSCELRRLAGAKQ
jgi:hypothetical protein